MRFERSISRFLLLGGCILAGLSLLLIWVGDAALRNEKAFTFTLETGEQLQGTYYLPDDPIPYGIMLLEGFGSDQVTMQNAANEFARMGLHVFCFDFTGHGRSQGTLGFDNAATDVQARQVIAALNAFQQISGLPVEHIVLMGHSLGARVAVQAMVIKPRDVAGLILFGPQINLGSNTQSEFFTGTSDSDLDWVQALGPNNPAMPILIVSGSWEDILTVPAASALIEKLTGGSTTAPGIVAQVDPSENDRLWVLIPGVFHNFEVFSSDGFSVSKAWLAKLLSFDAENVRQITTTTRRWASWIGCTVGLFSIVFGALFYSRQYPDLNDSSGAEVVSGAKFLASRYWLWFPGLILGIVILLPLWFIPIGFPAFNIYYVVFISGYGFLNLILLRYGKVPGVNGKVMVFKTNSTIDPKRWQLAIGLNLILLLLVIALIRSGWYWTPPRGDRLFWLVIFVPLTAIGFGTASIDQLLSRRIPKHTRIWVFFAGFVPFALYAVGLAILQSWSGLIGAVLGLLVLVLVSVQGAFTRRLTGNRWVAALLQALLLWLWVIPQGVLFSF